MYTPIITTKKIANLLRDIDKMDFWFPSVEIFRVSKEQYDNLLESIPEKIRGNYKKSIPYRGKTILHV